MNGRVRQLRVTATAAAMTTARLWRVRSMVMRRLECVLVLVAGAVGAVLALGGLQLGLYLALAHEAVAWVPAGRTAILANTTTIWVVPLSLVFLRERIPAARWLAAALGLAGVAVLINPLAIDWRAGSVLIATFGFTVVEDLTLGIIVGCGLAAIYAAFDFASRWREGG